MHIYCKNMARLLNRCCNGRSALHSWFIVTLCVNLNKTKLMNFPRIATASHIYVCCKATKYFSLLSTIYTYLHLQVKCQTFFSDFNKSLVFSAIFHKNLQYKNSQKKNPSSGGPAYTCRQTDGRSY